MIVTTKPLKVKLKHTKEPLADFRAITSQNAAAIQKEVLFVRYIGIPQSIAQYEETLHEMERHFAANATHIAYKRLQGLDARIDPQNSQRLSVIWEKWQAIDAQLFDAKLLQQLSLGESLCHETLEWTKKIAFLRTVAMYRKTTTNATVVKNFGIKCLHWMALYLPQLFPSPTVAPKLLFMGDIKQQELFFLYFLSQLGCDICYMNTKEDIAHLDEAINSYSTLYQCEHVYTAQWHLSEMPVAPQPKSTSLPIQTTEEWSYEQLAGLSSAVVMIKVYDEDQQIICGGSGVVIHSQGYIITNFHVVAGGHYYSVLYENDTEEYWTNQLVKYHQDYDLAILKVGKQCPALPVYRHASLVRGQKIVAIGSPLGLFNSISDGIVSGFRDIRSMPMIQFTAPISNGSSGGALLDMYGRLVGLNTAGFDGGQNLNLAVPAAILYQFAEKFIEQTI
ncbi:trypsin-like peptidase domain-containing protein [Lysinibacillus piscis]|uniref:Serine protease n=1 Tax=Lysinibacillus piscis TaxID=2518931 RepID=A0ABQ5NKJ9_9BACI|nr:trypsin-like peptidase domain-containing protein [Lysinibacillus sp. KH24]GLC88887.1 serine protease [Lysinibacillus sp. KH24]